MVVKAEAAIGLETVAEATEARAEAVRAVVTRVGVPGVEAAMAMVKEAAVMVGGVESQRVRQAGSSEKAETSGVAPVVEMGVVTVEAAKVVVVRVVEAEVAAAMAVAVMVVVAKVRVATAVATPTQSESSSEASSVKTLRPPPSSRMLN